MVLTKRRREQILWRKNRLAGARCETCNSEFELTLQHGNVPNKVARLDDEAYRNVRILCATCHFLEDHDKMYKCKPKAQLRKYYETCQKEANRYEKLLSKSSDNLNTQKPQ